MSAVYTKLMGFNCILYDTGLNLINNFFRVLSRSRDTKSSKNNVDVAEHHRLQSLEKAMVIQWLCFSPPSTIKDFQGISVMLLVKALMHRY
jgi:hypothetical protein